MTLNICFLFMLFGDLPMSLIECFLVVDADCFLLCVLLSIMVDNGLCDVEAIRMI